MLRRSPEKLVDWRPVEEGSFPSYTFYWHIKYTPSRDRRLGQENDPCILSIIHYLLPIVILPSIWCTNSCTNASEWYEVVNVLVILSCSWVKPYCQELQNPCATIFVATDTQFKCVTVDAISNFSKKLTPVDVFVQYISTAQTPTGVKLKQLI